jgi:hypothetical protein
MSVRQVTLALAATLLSSVVCGCGTTSVSPPTSVQSNVFVAGTVYNSGGVPSATYWKNGVATSLGTPVTVGGTTYGSAGSGIAVSGDDIYVVGSQGGPESSAVYWKDGTAFPLTDGTKNASANAIVISAGDVYIAGNEFGGDDSSGNPLPSTLEYWKNGVAVVLYHGVQPAQVNSIFVSGSDVYAAGFIYQTTKVASNSFVSVPVATVWKNGVPTSLTDSLHESSAESVFVSGSDVYAAGYAAQTSQGSGTAATYWKNGEQVTLSNVNGSNATSIFVSGTDVYVAGGDPVNTAEYWENGMAAPLIGSSTGQLVVANGNVYVAGSDFPTSAIGPNAVRPHSTGSWIGATYWTNGYPSPLAPTANTSSATAIAVVTP